MATSGSHLVTDGQMVAEVIAALFLFISGGVATLAPKVVQSLGRRVTNMKPVIVYISSDAYVTHTRIVGVLALAMAITIAVALYQQIISRF
jgi:hypothetical protein